MAPIASPDVDLKMAAIPVVMERRAADDPPKSPSTPETTQDPQTSQAAQAAAMSAPSMVRAGEIMLILSLLLIFLVASCVALHFYLRSRKRRNKRSGKTKDKKKKKKGEADGPPELHSQQKKIAELVGTPICEIGDSEPRHEMEDVEVQEVMTPIDEPIGSAISTFGHTAIPVVVQPAPEPEIREFATYWSARM